MMSTTYGRLFAVVGLLGACGGNVVVDGVPGGGGAGTGASTGTGTSASTSASTSTSTTTSTSTSSLTSSGVVLGPDGGIICVKSCGEAIASGIVPCDGLPYTSYGQLVACACVPDTCAIQCGNNLCQTHPMSMECASCMPSACPDEYAFCSAH